MSIYEELLEESLQGHREYNLLPKKNAVVTFIDFFNEDNLKKHRSGRTTYVCIKCIFHMIDDKEVQGQFFWLQLPINASFPQLLALMSKHSTKRFVKVAIDRPLKVAYTFNYIDTDNDTNTDIDTDTDTDTNTDTDRDRSELRVKLG